MSSSVQAKVQKVKDTWLTRTYGKKTKQILLEKVEHTWVTEPAGSVVQLFNPDDRVGVLWQADRLTGSFFVLF